MLSAIYAATPHNTAMNIRLFLGGLRPPKPSHRVGEWGNPGSPFPLREGQALPWAGTWGYPVSPHPSPRAAPSQTLPPGEEMEKPGFSIPLREGQTLPWAGRLRLPALLQVVAQGDELDP